MPGTSGLRDAQAPSITGIAIAGSPNVRDPSITGIAIPGRPDCRTARLPSITGIAIPGRPDCRTPRLTASPELQLPDIQVAGLPGSQHHRNCNCRTSKLPDSQADSITGIAIAGRPSCRTPRIPASPELQLPDVQTSGIPASPELQFRDVRIAGLPGSQHHRNCNCRTSIMLNVQAHDRTGIAIAGSPDCRTPRLTASPELQLPEVHNAERTGSRHDRNCNRRTSKLPDSQDPSITGIAIAGRPNVRDPSITGIAIPGRPDCRTARLPASPELQLPDVHNAERTGSRQDRNCNCRKSGLPDSQAHSIAGIAIAGSP